MSVQYLTEENGPNQCSKRSTKLRRKRRKWGGGESKDKRETEKVF